MAYGYSRIDWPFYFDATGGRRVLFRLQPEGCLPGSFLNNMRCEPCPMGTFSLEKGALDWSACSACPEGKFSAANGSTHCSDCGLGTHQGLVGGTSCPACPPGSFQSRPGKPSCLSCKPGTFVNASGAAECLLCPHGTTQAVRGSLGCNACAPGSFSSPGDAECARCWSTPAPETHPLACVDDAGILPDRLDSVWITTTGQQGSDDECIGQSTSGAGLQQLEEVVTCQHTMRFMGRPELARSWTSASRVQLHRPVLLEVVPYNETFYPAVCAKTGLSLAYFVRDALGNTVTNLVDAEAVLSFTDPLSGDLLYWTACTELPRLVQNGSIVAVGRCKASSSFCPGTDVEARVSLSWPGGNAVQGSHILRAGVPAPCPPSSSWLMHVELASPDVPYFQGDAVRVLVRSVSSPGRIVGFRFQVQLLNGATLQALSSAFVTSHRSTDQGVLSVEGDNTGMLGRDDALLCELTVLHSARISGLHGVLKVVPHSFQVTLEDRLSFEVLVRTQGFVCGDEQAVLVALFDLPRITAVIAESSRKQMVHWRSIQESAGEFGASVETIAVWNTHTDQPAGDGGAISVVVADCSSLDPEILVAVHCSRIHAGPAHGLGGTGRVLVRAQGGGASTVVAIRVLVPASPPNVTSVVSIDGLSGRYKVLVRLLLRGEDVFGTLLDATPFLQSLPAASGVQMDGEEWQCVSKTGKFWVGQPVLFEGECARRETYTGGLVPFLFTGGQGEVHGRGFRFSRSIIMHPQTPNGVLLLFTASEGLLWPRVTLDGSDFKDRLSVSRDQLGLLARGMSPRCIPFSFHELPHQFVSIPVYPPAPTSLHVILSTYVLVTQHDIADILPSRADVIEAWIVLSNDERLDILGDSRLQLETEDDLDIIHPAGIKSRTTGGVFSVGFRMAGMQCLAYTATVRVHPFSITSAELECPDCPAMLTMEEDPMTALFPSSSRFVASVAADWFVLRCVLVDGSRRDKVKVQLTVEGEGVLKNGRITGTAEGMARISTPLARTVYQMPVIKRWAKDVELLCNGVGCVDPGVLLAPPGDGAALAPFLYSTTLSISTRFVLADRTTITMPIPEGMVLYVNDKETAVDPRSGIIPLPGPGPLELKLFVPQDAWQIASTAVTVQVHGLQTLRVSGPPVLFQIHCSRVWEQAAYHVTGALSDGAVAEVHPQFAADGLVIVMSADVERSPNMFTSETGGDGWISVTFGDFVKHVEITATLSSKYVEAVRLDFLPRDWTTPLQTPLALAPEIVPELSTNRLSELKRQILTWAVSEEGVVGWGPDFESMTLLSDYYQPLTVTCTVARCDGRDRRLFSREVNVNVRPDRQGQVDLGAKYGPPLPLVAVGQIMPIPVYIFAEARLFAYRVHAQFESVALRPVHECSAGEFPASTCKMSRSRGFSMSGEFLESQRSGRILVGVIHGRVMLDALSHIQVGIERLFMDELTAASPSSRTPSPYTHVSAFRFAVKLGTAELTLPPHQRVLTEIDPVASLLLVQGAVLEEDPASLVVCCNTTVMKPGMRLARVFPSVFRLESIRLTWAGEDAPSSSPVDVMDPRVQLEYDRSLLRFLPDASWQILDSGEWGQQQEEAGSATPITVWYTHPGTLGKLRHTIFIALAEVQELVLEPAVLELRRIHCSPSIFQSACVTPVAVLRHGLGNIALIPGDPLTVSTPPGIHVEPTVHQVCVRADGVGVRDITVTLAGQISQTLPVFVLDASIVFARLELADPLRAAACRHENVTIPVVGILQDGSSWRELQRFGAATLLLPSPVGGAIQLYPSGLQVTVLDNSGWGQSSAITVVLPSCEEEMEEHHLTISSHVHAEVTPCLDSMHRRADVITELFEDHVELSLVGGGQAFFVHLRTQEGLAAPLTCEALDVSMDCAVTVTSSSIDVLIAGTTAAGLLVRLTPRPAVLWGFVEVFAEGVVSRNMVDAGRIGPPPPPTGSHDPVRQLTMMPDLPVLDAAGLCKKTDETLRGANPLFLLTGRHRLVTMETYSNDRELSIMFRVTDRFLVPDRNNSTRITCTLADATGKLPLLPGAVRHENGDQIVTATPVQEAEGWYAIQSEGASEIPVLDLVVKEVSIETSSSYQPWELVLSDEERRLHTGQTLHACPRTATDRARFVLVFRVFPPQEAFPPPQELTDRLACTLHVAARRIVLGNKNDHGANWSTLSVSVESFVRVRQVLDAVLNPSFKTLLGSFATPENGTTAWRRRRELHTPLATVTAVEMDRMIYTDDKGDGNVSCPQGTFFSRNGTYQKLPEHAHAGKDCYGMVCVNGYTELPNMDGNSISCVPESVSTDIAWVCVTAILFSVAFVTCVIFCVKASRSTFQARSLAPTEAPLTAIVSDYRAGGGYMDDMDLALAELDDTTHPSFNTRHWGSISEVVLDDHSLMMIEGEFSPVPRDESRRHAR